MKHILKKLSVQFLRYAIELLYVKRRTCHKCRSITSDRHHIWHTDREYEFAAYLDASNVFDVLLHTAMIVNVTI